MKKLYSTLTSRLVSSYRQEFAAIHTVNVDEFNISGLDRPYFRRDLIAQMFRKIQYTNHTFVISKVGHNPH